MFSQNDTLLHLAVRNENLDQVKILLEQKADPNVRGFFGQTPLHYAVIKNSPELVSVLLNNGADPNIQQNDGDKPIHVAAAENATKALKALIEFDPKQLKNEGRDRNTAFQRAAMNGNTETMDILLEQFKEDINQIDRSTGETMLHLAVINNDVGLINYFLEMNANIEALNKRKLTPLQASVSIPDKPSVDAALTLIQAKANVNAGETPALYLLAENYNGDMYRVKELAEALLRGGANIKNKYGDDPRNALRLSQNISSYK